MAARLRWGIIGTAKIAREWLIPAIQRSRNAEVTAIASRNVDTARQFALDHDIAQFHGSYEALLENPAVDAVYIPLPNDFHVPLTLKAIAAGKHVLCEKPLGLNSTDIQPILAASSADPQLVVMEAFMYRFHPQWVKARQLIAQGVLGEITAIDAGFSYFNRDPDNVRNKPGSGGGGLLDIGCYCVSVARWLFEREPVRVCGLRELDPDFGVDRHFSGLLDFAPGMASFFCSTQSDAAQHVKISGTLGSLTVENPFYSRKVASRLLLWREHQLEVIDVGEHDHYVAQVEAFSDAALSGAPAPTPLSDALGNLKVLDALTASAVSNGWQGV